MDTAAAPVTIEKSAYGPNDLVCLTSSALMCLALDAPEAFEQLKATQRTGGRILATTAENVVIDVGADTPPLEIPWNPQFPHRTILPVSDVDGNVAVPGQTQVNVSMHSERGPVPSYGPLPDEQPQPMTLPQVPVVQQVVGAMPMPQFPFPLFQPPQNGPDLSRRVVPVRVAMGVQFISQILTLRQSAIGYATSLLAEHGLAKAHRPRPEAEPWQQEEGEEEPVKPLPPMPTVQLTKEEHVVYNNALRKLDTWMMQDDDDLPWNQPAQTQPFVAEAALGSEPGPS